MVRDPSRVPRAPHRIEVPSPATGVVSGFSTRRIGMLAVELGAGRKRIDDRINPATGFLFLKKLGDRVEKGEPLAVVHAADLHVGAAVAKELAGCCALSDGPVVLPPRVSLVIDAAGVRAWATPVIH